MSATVLTKAANLLRSRVAASTKATIDMPMVSGIWISSAHYLTSTPKRDTALADWLDETAQTWDTAQSAPALVFATEILRTKEGDKS